MENPVMLVTGGSRGIGAATVRLATERGIAVAFSYRAEADAANALAAETGALAVQADAADEAATRALFEAVDARFGRLDVLVNNAGVVAPASQLADMDTARMERVFRVNVLGAFLAAREAVRRMSTARGGAGGAIVNVSSAAARMGSPGEYIDYAASKGAIDTMTLGLAKEVATQGIRVNAVRPGLIATDIHASGGEPGRIERLRGAIPMHREGRAEEVAEAILWLASDAASYVTGALLDVAGGR